MFQTAHVPSFDAVTADRESGEKARHITWKEHGPGYILCDEQGSCKLI